MKSYNKWRPLIFAGILLALFTIVLGLVKPGIFMDFGMWLTSNVKHRNAATEAPAFTLYAEALSSEIKSSPEAINKYMDKAILLEGMISSVEGNHLALGNVICSLDSAEISKLSNIKPGDPVKIQGRLTTYNDVLEEIMVDQCILK